MCQAQCCVVRQVSIGSKAGWSCPPAPRGSCTTGWSGKVSGTAVTPSDCQADLTGLVGVPAFLTAPKVVQFTSVTFPENVECSYLSPSPGPIFALNQKLSKMQSDHVTHGLTFSLAWSLRSFMSLTKTSYRSGPNLSTTHPNLVSSIPFPVC